MCQAGCTKQKTGKCANSCKAKSRQKYCGCGNKLQKGGVCDSCTPPVRGKK
jgi:hypothetical protein